MCTCTDHSRRVILLTEHARGMAVVTTYRTSTLQYVHWAEQRSSQGVHGTGAIDNGSPYQCSSYVNLLERTRCLSCKILEKPTLHWTWHKPTTARTLTQIETNTSSTWQEHHFHVHTSRYQETSYQNKHRRMVSLPGPRRSHYHTSASLKIVYTACRSHPNERLPTSTVKEQMFLLTKLKTRRQCTCTCYIFQSDPCVVSGCRRSSLPAIGRLDGTQITLTLSSLLQTLVYHQQTLDRRFPICIRSRSILSAADSTVLSWRLSCVHVLRWRRSPLRLLNVFSRIRTRTLPCPFPFIQPHPTSLCVTVYCSRHHWTQTEYWMGCIERIRIDTCAECRPAGQGHHRNVCVWTSRLSGAHYRPETATLPEICRLLLAKLWLRSN